MNSPSPHVDIGDLLADPVSGLTWAHLASCPDCRADADRWESVADGVRELVTSTAAPPGNVIDDAVMDGTAARGKPRRVRYATAAAVLLLGGASYGLAATLGGTAHSAAHGSGAVLTAVSGCSGLVQADGTLTQVNGTNVVITTASGQPVTATTSNSTRTTVSKAPLGDIANGDKAVVAGPQANGTIQARMVVLGTTSLSLPPLPWGSPARGTVADASDTGFTLVTSGGTQIPVTTSSRTFVTLVDASLSQLRAGAYTIAVGYAEPNGTLAASVITQPQLIGVLLAVTNCTPGSLDRVITAALVNGG